MSCDVHNCPSIQYVTLRVSFRGPPAVGSWLGGGSQTVAPLGMAYHGAGAHAERSPEGRSAPPGTRPGVASSGRPRGEGRTDLGGLKRRGGSGRHGTRRQRDQPRHDRGWSSYAFTPGLTSRHGAIRGRTQQRSGPSRSAGCPFVNRDLRDRGPRDRRGLRRGRCSDPCRMDRCGSSCGVKLTRGAGRAVPGRERRTCQCGQSGSGVWTHIAASQMRTAASLMAAR